MIEPKTTRLSLGLYGALFVLPTLTFGWLYWRELVRAHDAEMAAVPMDAEDGARRIAGTMKKRLDALVANEAARPFTEFGEYVLPPGTLGDEILPQRSDLTQGRLPTGVLAYFSFDRSGDDRAIDVFVGQETFGRSGVAEAYVPVIDEFRHHRPDATILTSVGPEGPLQAFPLSAVAIAIGGGDLQCVKRHSGYMLGRTITARVDDYRLHFYVDDQGYPRAIASRRVRASVGPNPLEMPRDAACLDPLVKGFHLQQGFLIDVRWLLSELPFELAGQMLGPNQSLVTSEAGTMDRLESKFASLLPVEELGFEIFDVADLRYGQLDVEIDTTEITDRFERQQRNLLALALMLVLTLAAGMTLLYRSVNRELEQAHRMQNFVAAVTHELRTPISTIKLHGEMLLDGWVDETKQSEYYQRIVRETGRLSTLVENVLEKSRLKESVTTPEPGDLNELVRRAERDLASGVGTDDLAYELAPRLPQVWLTPEGVRGILSNLVENARKYAPVAEGGEPILIRTRWDGERALLEVLDRGPGVPKEEHERIFEAFYRVGSEATRTATGTGLGLHLVQLHADAAGARVSIQDRPGGGSIFRIAWRAATA